MTEMWLEGWLFLKWRTDMATWSGGDSKKNMSCNIKGEENAKAAASSRFCSKQKATDSSSSSTSKHNVCFCEILHMHVWLLAFIHVCKVCKVTVKKQPV